MRSLHNHFVGSLQLELTMYFDKFMTLFLREIKREVLLKRGESCVWIPYEMVRKYLLNWEMVH